MNNQVLSIEQMQELIDMGIDTSKASMCWIISKLSRNYNLYFNVSSISFDKEDFTYIPTFTLQDILEMLPKTINVADTRTDKEEYIGINHLRIGYPTMLDRLYLMYTKDMNMNSGWATFDAEDSLLNAAFNMLKWCKQNKHI